MLKIKNTCLFMKMATLLLVSSFLMFSCNKKDLSKIAAGTWNPNFAIPLAYGEFGVYDILAVTDSLDELAIDSETGLISLIYSGELYNLQTNDFFTLNDVSTSFNANLLDFGMTPQLVFNQTVNASLDETIIFNLNGHELHELLFKDGSLNVNLSSDFQHNLTAVITFPGMTRNGNVVSETINLPYTGGTSTENLSIDLENVLSNFNTTGTPNQLAIEIELTLEGTGNEVVGTENVSISINLNNLDFIHFRGLISPEEVNFTDSISIRLFDAVTDGTFSFTNPKITFSISNGFGIPMRIDFNELKSIRKSSGEEYPLTGFTNELTISSPVTIGDEITTELLINKSNTSNLGQIFGSTPNYFYYDLDLNVNPNGVMAPLHFMARNSELRLSAEVDLPLEGFAYGFEFRDTLDFETGEDFEDAEAIKFVMFRLIIENGFPVDIDAQINFMDENHNILFAAFSTVEDIVRSGQVNAAGKVIATTRKISDITLEEAEIQLLNQVKYFEIHALGQTKNGPTEQTVRIHDDCILKTQLSMQIEASQSL